MNTPKFNGCKHLNIYGSTHGGAYRRFKTMIAAHAKAGKDRAKAGKRKEAKR